MQNSQLPILAPRIGKIKHYLVHEIIGQGAFSHVYRAIDPFQPQEYALKLHKNLHNSYRFYEKEVTALQQIKHLNVINLHHNFTEKDMNILVLEYCNQTLEQFLGNQKKLCFAEKDALMIFKGVAEGLQAVHEAGFMHRDLKLKNILMKDKVPKIADFGVSKQIKDNEINNTQCGTVQFMSPQILQGLNYSKKTDIWSLGIIFYKVLFGVFPFAATADKQEILLQINKNQAMNNKFNINTYDLQYNKISQELQQLIENMLRIDENERFSIYEVCQEIDLMISKQKQQQNILNFYKMETKKLGKKSKNVSISGTQRLQKEQTIKLQPVANFPDFHDLNTWKSYQFKNNQLILTTNLNNKHDSTVGSIDLPNDHETQLSKVRYNEPQKVYFDPENTTDSDPDRKRLQNSQVSKQKFQKNEKKGENVQVFQRASRNMSKTTRKRFFTPQITEEQADMEWRKKSIENQRILFEKAQMLLGQNKNQKNEYLEDKQYLNCTIQTRHIQEQKYLEKQIKKKETTGRNFRSRIISLNQQ